MNDYRVYPKGRGRFFVEGQDEGNFVTIKAGVLECTCKEWIAHGACSHQTEALRFIAEIPGESDYVELPDPLEINQLNVEEINYYLIRMSAAGSSVNEQLIGDLKRYNHYKSRVDVGKLKAQHISKSIMVAQSVLKSIRP